MSLVAQGAKEAKKRCAICLLEIAHTEAACADFKELALKHNLSANILQLSNEEQKFEWQAEAYKAELRKETEEEKRINNRTGH